MKLQPDRSDAQTISGHGPGWIAVDGRRHEQSMIVGSRGELLPWNCGRFEDLNAAHFARLAAMGAELVIFGSGARIRFPSPGWLAPLMERRIGLETMDTAAACRTYNILAGEGRHVLAAVLVQAPA